MRAVALFIFLSVLILADAAQDDSGRSDKSYKRSLQSKTAKSFNVEDNASAEGKISDTDNSKSGQRNKRSVGISAWGIIGIIVAVISLSTIGYYAFVLYPHLCKRRRSYDMMELSDVV